MWMRLVAVWGGAREWCAGRRRGGLQSEFVATFLRGSGWRCSSLSWCPAGRPRWGAVGDGRVPGALCLLALARPARGRCVGQDGSASHAASWDLAGGEARL